MGMSTFFDVPKSQTPTKPGEWYYVYDERRRHFEIRECLGVPGKHYRNVAFVCIEEIARKFCSRMNLNIGEKVAW